MRGQSLTYAAFSTVALDSQEGPDVAIPSPQAKLILEKSMIGRLQNELVRANSQMGELDTQLERLKRAEAECERLQQRITDLESSRESADSSLSAAKSKARP